MSIIRISGTAAKFRRYSQAVERAGGQPSFEGDPDRCAGLLLPGGGDVEPWRYGQENRACAGLDPERDAEEWALLDRFTAAGKPVFGICRGMQLLNVYFGGTLIQDLPGHDALESGDRMHLVRGLLFDPLWGHSVVVNSAHHQAVDRLGRRLQAVQWAEDGVIEAFRHRDLPVWGVQWHPERLPGNVGERLFRAFLERCGNMEQL